MDLKPVTLYKWNHEGFGTGPGAYIEATDEEILAKAEEIRARPTLQTSDLEPFPYHMTYMLGPNGVTKCECPQCRRTNND